MRAARILAAALAVSWTWDAGRGQTAADDSPVTTIQVAAEHPDGRPYPGLEAGDFTLLLNGNPHAIEAVQPGPHPLRLALLIDVTISPPGADIAPLRRAVDRIARALAPHDAMRVWTIGGGVKPGPPFTSDERAILKAAGPALAPAAADRSGPSPIWDAVVDATTALEAERGTRTIVLVTDGRATGNRHGLSDAILGASRAGVSVNVLGPASTMVFLNDTRIIAVRPERMLESLVANTGGRLVPWDRGGRQESPVADLLAGIVESARHEYRLTIRPPEGDSVQLIEVRVARPDLKLRARRVL